MVFIAHYNPMRTMRLAAFALAGCIACLRVTTLHAETFEHSVLMQWIGLLGGNIETAGHIWGWVGASCSAAALAFLVDQMRHQRVVLRADRDGVYWHRWAHKPILWSNVLRVQKTVVRNQTFISLSLRDPARNRSRGLLGVFAPVNSSLGYGDIGISAAGLDKDIGEIWEAVATHFSEYQLSLRSKLGPIQLASATRNHSHLAPSARPR
jgi:hypothetical protein